MRISGALACPYKPMRPVVRYPMESRETQMMTGMSRRNFMGVMGAMGAASVAAAAGVANAEESKSASTQAEQVVLSDGTVWNGTPAEIAALGGSTMPREELNRRRKEYVDSQTDFVAEDGTVIPAVYVKMRALLHTYGLGCGEGDLDPSMFTRVMKLFTEEQVAGYLEMPWDDWFTAAEFYYKSQKEGTGRSYEECKELCEVFSKAGWLPFRTHNEGIVYNIPSFTAEGVNTYTLCDEYYADPFNFDWPFMTSGIPEDHALMGTPAYLSIPISEDVVAEGSDLLAYDDIDLLIEDHEYIAVQPCSCRYGVYVNECHEKGEDFPTFVDFCTGDYSDFRDGNGDRIETCLAMGDDAEYLVSLGLGRRITKEEAHAMIQQSREDGFMIHCLYGKEHAWVCQCNPKVCGITAQWAAGAEALGGWDVLEEKSIGFNHRSHYTLEVDFDKCIKCGACMARCPMEAIAMEGEGGTPQVTDHLCMRCGQCAYVCPQEARKLALRPMDEIPELPHQLEDDNNLKGAYRFEHGLIGRGTTPALDVYTA